ERQRTHGNGCRSRRCAPCGERHSRGSSPPEAAMIKAIKFASVPVRDQDRALEFYTGKLGFRVITDSPFNETQRWIELGIPRADTKLVLFTALGQEQMIGGVLDSTRISAGVEAAAGG